MKIGLLILLNFSALVFGGCLPLTGDRILGRDLAMAEPQFAALPATLTLGFAPAPGMQRIFAAAELTRVALANGIAVINPRESCFEIPLRNLSLDEAAHSMKAVLPIGAELTVMELSAAGVPPGDLEFPLTGLEPATATGIQIWHGAVKFTSTRKTPVWARVAITQELEAVVLFRDLAPNVTIDAAALRLARWSGPLLREKVAVRLEDVLGRISTRPLKAVSVIPLALLTDAPDVRRGDAIRVEVNSGRAHLILHAVAGKDGRNGDVVELRNPATGKTFRARLEGSKAVVRVDTGGVLPLGAL